MRLLHHIFSELLEFGRDIRIADITNVFVRDLVPVGLESAKHRHLRAFEISIWRSDQTWSRITSPTWCLQASYKRGCLNSRWITTQPAVRCPVFEDVVSNTIPITDPTQFHSLRRLTVAFEIRSPAFSFDLWGRAGTPSNLGPPIPDIRLSCLYRGRNS